MLSMLDPTVVDQIATALPEASRRDFLRRVDRLNGLPAQDSDMGSFLGTFAESVAELYAASSVAIWFRTPAGGIQRKVDVGWLNMGMDDTTEMAHENLISFAIQRAEPMAVTPFSAPVRGAAVSNPTDSFLLLASIDHEGQPVAVLELTLGPKPLRRPHQALVSCHLEWLTWLTGILRLGMERRFAASQPPPLEVALACIDHVTQQVAEMQDRVRLAIQASLHGLAGNNFGSLHANQTVAKQVHALLDSKGLRVRCPECGSPAILRCQKAGNSRTGAFVFDHYLENGRTFHGGPSVFPKLNLVSKPPRRGSS
jgi:predicted RNA-binding Zn-ribbon protein involved in translation (DUF1610 family)